MFEAGCGFGVGLGAAVLEEACLGPLDEPGPVRSRPPRLGELFPVQAGSDAWLVEQLQELQRRKAADAAYEAELVVELAERRPAVADHPLRSAVEAELGADPPEGVSEFFVEELPLVLNCSPTAAGVLFDQARTLLDRLPRTWAALADGRLDWPRARALAAELGPGAPATDAATVAEVEAAILPDAAQQPVGRLRAAARRELLARDAAAAELRREQAERLADVRVRPMGDGLAELAASLPAATAAACREAVDGYARMLRADGDARGIGQLRAAALTDLLLRPWDTTRPPVTAHLQVVAPLAALIPSRPDPPWPAPVAEVAGQPITAAQLRSLLAELDALCPGGLQAPAGGSLELALVEPRTGALRAVVTRRELERAVRRGCAEHPGGACACPLLERPAEVDRYRPGAAQRRFVTTRDRSCRHPGCRNRAGWSDLDHVVPHGRGGPTACENLCCLCRRHHRLKTHAPGWSFVLDDRGVLTVTTPSGVRRVTRPPGLHPPADLPAASFEDPPPF